MLFLHAEGMAQAPQPDLLKRYREMDSIGNGRPQNLLRAQNRMPLTGTNSNYLQTVPFKNLTVNKNLTRQILPSSIEKNTNPVCMDTSARLVYKKDSTTWFSPDYLTKTKDGNILIPGFDYNWIVNHTDAHLLKVTQQGDTLWSKSIQGGYDKQFIDVYKSFELNDGSILLAGDINVPTPYNGRSDLMLLRVTATGNLIWEKTFKSKYWDYDTTTGSINIFDCKQDANGNLYVCGDIRAVGTPAAALGFKMDLAGNILWSKGYAIGVYPVATGINIINQQVTFFGRTLARNSIDCFAIVADASTGDTLSYKYLSSSHGDFWHAFFEDEMVKLKNGNLMLYGAGISDGSTFDPTQLPTHAGMIEVTPDFNFVRSYLFRSPVSDDTYNTRITAFGDGSAAFTRLKYFSPFRANTFFGNFKNGQILKERMIPYQVAISWVSNFIQLDDGGQLVTSLFGDSSLQLSATELMKLHNSDTSGSCLGTDTSATIIENETFYNAVPYIDSVSVNVLTENFHPFAGIFNDDFTIGTNCKQISFCDSLKLLISRDTVCANTSVSISIKKNKECGAMPLWNYDTTAVSSFYKLNDSTIFATVNKPWQGYISASIEGCKTLFDSVHFTVLQAPSLLDLGTDTVICPGNTLLLNAKQGYASYVWQDGSVDSVFLVTSPGIYYVKTTDACGGFFTDTVTVGSHPPITFDIGPDLSICKNDTANIIAPAGFIHYQWTSYNISNDTAQDVNIFPSKNTWYKVVAEKTPGCFASDSLYVTVKNLSPVNLGNDTSFCANQYVTLNAGAGFDTWKWNTGSLNQMITVNQQGTYSVQATLNGCSSYDTLQVLNVYPLPVFSLGNDTALCWGQQLQFSFNLLQALYKWNTGSNLNTFTINQAGTYWLQVSQQGCVKGDTVIIIYNPSPILNLGNDTTLCEHQTLLLNAFNGNATYTWQDGTSAPDYRVSKAGVYFVIADLSNCKASDMVTITYKALPFFTLGKDSFLCTGQQYILSPLLNTGASLLWQDGSMGPMYNVSKEGLYVATAFNECGSYTDSVIISSGVCNIMMPSAFTPNGDGINDLFKVKYPFPLKQFNMVIYDRWGEKIFETNSIDGAWDGTWKGNPCTQNSYVWIIRFINSGNDAQQLKGVVTLLR